jgi:hypothetical protein
MVEVAKRERSASPNRLKPDCTCNIQRSPNPEHFCPQVLAAAHFTKQRFTIVRRIGRRAPIVHVNRRRLGAQFIPSASREIWCPAEPRGGAPANAPDERPARWCSSSSPVSHSNSFIVDSNRQCVESAAANPMYHTRRQWSLDRRCSWNKADRNTGTCGFCRNGRRSLVSRKAFGSLLAFGRGGTKLRRLSRRGGDLAAVKWGTRWCGCATSRFDEAFEAALKVKALSLARISPY